VQHRPFGRHPTPVQSRPERIARKNVPNAKYIAIWTRRDGAGGGLVCPYIFLMFVEVRMLAAVAYSRWDVVDWWGVP